MNPISLLSRACQEREGLSNRQWGRIIKTSIPYVLAVVFTALTSLFRLWLTYYVNRPALVLFVIPILFSAYIGGLGPGLLATVLSAGITLYYFTPPFHSLAISSEVDALQWLIFCICGVLISLLCEKWRRSVRRANELAQKSSKTGRALRMISDCNQELVRATNEADLLKNICRLIVERCDYRMAWVGFAGQDAAKSVRPAAQFGFEGGYLDTVNITWADTERGRGPVGTAIRTGQPVIARNILTDPAYGPWREAAIKRGYASSIALPLQHEGRCFGVLSLYAATPDAFDPEEVKLLSELAGDLAYGIGALRHRAGLKQAELALRESENKFRLLFDLSPDGIMLEDSSGRILEVNSALCCVLGYSREELIGKNVRMLVPGELQSSVEQHIAGVLAKKKIEHEVDNLGKDGSVHQIELYEAAVTLSNGQPGILVASRDITERKQAEKERERLIAELREALAKVKTLSGLIPICAGCKKIRDDKGYWSQVDSYIARHTDAKFTHGYCPDCIKKYYPGFEEDDTDNP